MEFTKLYEEALKTHAENGFKTMHTYTAEHTKKDREETLKALR